MTKSEIEQDIKNKLEKELILEEEYRKEKNLKNCNHIAMMIDSLTPRIYRCGMCQKIWEE